MIHINSDKESNLTLRSGFDSAKTLEEEDSLNRWGFANEIYTIATRTPADWSVRIGIYGGWGEGKTTILKFVKEIALKNKQIVVSFNPWEFNSSTEMWENFVQTVYDNLRSHGIKLKLPSNIWLWATIKIKKLFRKPIDLFAPLTQLNPYLNAGLPIIKNFLSFNKKNIKKLANIKSGKQIIILVDDLDRANPIIVPQLLFALKELLDIPSMVFVLAFDPLVIKNILSQNKIDANIEYLDKIIDFPKWLPKVDEANLRLMIERDIKNELSFLRMEYLDQVFPLLGNNPRKIKQILRLFIGFDKELDRYSADEINWPLFLLINIFKIKYPLVIDFFFNNSTVWQKLYTERHFGQKQSGIEEEPAYVSAVKKICEKLGLKESENEILTNIKEIIKLDRSYSPETFLQYLYLSERPTIITLRELNFLIKNYESDPKTETFDEMLSSFTAASIYPEKKVLEGLLLKLIEYWDWNCGQALDSVSHDKLNSHIKDSLLSLDLIERICFDKNGFVGESPVLNESHFEAIYKCATKWIHITMPHDSYSKIRSKEYGLLHNICIKTTLDPTAFLLFLKPWSSYRRGVYDQKEEKFLANELSKILEEKLSKILIDKFNIDNWINSIFIQESHQAEHYILLDNGSYLWTSPLRGRFFELLNKVDKSINVSKNMFDFLSILSSLYLEPGSSSIVSKDKSILYDEELIQAIWDCAVLEEINPRMFKGLEEFKEKILNEYSINLVTPKWWTEIKILVNNKQK